MTTSVFYASDAFNAITRGASQTRSFNNNLANAATVTQCVNSTGTKSSPSFAMTTGTLTNTPASGDVLLVVLQYGDNNAVTTAPSGWALLTAGGTAGSRRLEIWWYRSTGVAADKGPFTFNCTAGASFFGTQFFCVTGNGACADPVVETGATAFASAAAVTATAAPAASFLTPEAPGMTLTAFVVGGGTISSISGAFSGTGTQESHTTYIDTGFNRGASSVVDIYNNTDFTGSPTFGTAWSWTTSRAGHYAVIQFSGGGRSDYTIGDNLGVGMGIKQAGVLPYLSAMCEGFMSFDTSSIPDSNTISSATLTLRASNQIGSGLGALTTDDPANADLQVRYHGTTMPSNTRGNNNNHWWMTPAAFAAKTLVASYPAASAWVNGTDYALTNNGSNLINNISKTSSTVFALATSDIATSTTRTTFEVYAYQYPATYSTLTVVHSFVGSATVAATLTTTPTLSRIATFPRTIASTITSTPAIATVTSYLRTIASSIDLTPVLTRVPNFVRTITATLTGTASVATEYLPMVVGIPRQLVLKVRDRVSLPGSGRIRITVRNILRLPEE